MDNVKDFLNILSKIYGDNNLKISYSSGRVLIKKYKEPFLDFYFTSSFYEHLFNEKIGQFSKHIECSLNVFAKKESLINDLIKASFKLYSAQEYNIYTAYSVYLKPMFFVGLQETSVEVVKVY